MNIPLRFSCDNLVDLAPSNSPIAPANTNNDFLTRRNFIPKHHRKDELIEWMKETLYHSFALNSPPESYYQTMVFFEELIKEHIEFTKQNEMEEEEYDYESSDSDREEKKNDLVESIDIEQININSKPKSKKNRKYYTKDKLSSRLSQLVPTVSKFHTELAIAEAFIIYDKKFCITKRQYIPPSFLEIRQMLNLAQIISIGNNLKLICFDGDQTLYQDGDNFNGKNLELALSIIRLMCNGVKVALITAAGYGYDGSKYEVRLRGLLDNFIEEKLTEEQINNFYVFGGECNYLLQCHAVETKENDDILSPSSPLSSSTSTSSSTTTKREAKLFKVDISKWQNKKLKTHRPDKWPQDQIEELLTIAEETMHETKENLGLRAQIIKKERSIGIIPGGIESKKDVPIGHGSRALKREILDEIVLKIYNNIIERKKYNLKNNLRNITIPFCIFNGGRDSWLDIGDKSIGIEILQKYFNILPSQTLHVGDQFLSNGNDIAARKVCPTIWITDPKETGKILQYILQYNGLKKISDDDGVISQRNLCEGYAGQMNVYTGAME